MNDEIQEAVEYMNELAEEGSVPKNIKIKLSEIIKELQSSTKENRSLRLNKLLCDLDEISADANLDQFTRQQIWSISSMLEGLSMQD